VIRFYDLNKNYEKGMQEWVTPSFSNEVFERSGVEKVFFLLLLLVVIGTPLTPCQSHLIKFVQRLPASGFSIRVVIKCWKREKWLRRKEKTKDEGEYLFAITVEGGPRK
jgi:hypothetical protein